MARLAMPSVDEVEQRLGDRLGCRRAAGDAEVDREHGLDGPDELVGCPSRPQPRAQSPRAATRRGSGIAA